jgi:predicted Ser/Thr protein kinase
MPARRNKIVLNKGKKWDYDEKKSIGEGGFGKVFGCSNKITGVDMAVKIVDHKKSGMTRRQVEKEVEYMSKAVHVRHTFGFVAMTNSKLTGKTAARSEVPLRQMG